MNIYFTYEGENVVSFLSSAPNSGDYNVIDKNLLIHGYDTQLYTVENGQLKPKSSVEVEQIAVANQQMMENLEKEAVGNDVILQHIIQEKKAELQWDSSTQYSIGDVVYHNGSMWRATSNNSNNPPDDVPGDWEQIV